ncbi:hypothetical protein [Paenibacillus harenae]|uniref:hypothetical protein n=1 Tax=Paenibacillus harenae TaxID=306543 RepID=UPI0012EB78AC|nr:hypothetical protein [Paenibacillus harenae]
MHDVRDASMVYFDCAGAVEVEVTKNVGEIHGVAIRPSSAGIDGVVGGNRVTFTMDGPRKLSLEVNGDRFHNLNRKGSDVPEFTNQRSSRSQTGVRKHRDYGPCT